MRSVDDGIDGLREIVRRRQCEADYDLSNVDEWDPMGTGHYRGAKLTPQQMWGSADTQFASFGVEPEDVPEQFLEVWYSDSLGVAVNLCAYGEDRLHFGQLATFDPDDARELAAAIYQAAEELERRREAER
ncbi:MAG: hypothetical protein ABEJ90_01665 [Halobacterium sp.]